MTHPTVSPSWHRGGSHREPNVSEPPAHLRCLSATARDYRSTTSGPCAPVSSRRRFAVPTYPDAWQRGGRGGDMKRKRPRVVIRSALHSARPGSRLTLRFVPRSGPHRSPPAEGSSDSDRSHGGRSRSCERTVPRACRTPRSPVPRGSGRSTCLRPRIS